MTIFEMIPVIDVKNGIAVHGRGGDREHYQPVASRLCDGSSPGAIIAAYQRCFRTNCVYIADLDAITGGAPQTALIQTLLRDASALEIWCDSGIRTAGDLATRGAGPRLRHVIGSETLASADELRRITRVSDNPPVLSLDFKGSEFLGDEQLLARTDDWPRDVITLNLSHVGRGTGPPTQDLKTLRANAPAGVRFYLGGGTRNLDDLKALYREGVDGALVATALHSGAIDPQQWLAWSTK